MRVFFKLKPCSSIWICTHRQ